MKRIGWIILVLVLAAQGVAAQGVTNEEPAAQPVAVPTIPGPAQSAGTLSSYSNSEVLSILINTRTDLEVLANQQLGSERPVGWSGSLDVNDPQLPILIRLDLELLMARLVGLENIPAGWFGAVPSTPYAIARDIRHDLELLADVTIGPSIRPPGWAGDEAIMRCDRSTQNLVELLAREGLFTPTILPTNPSYCWLTGIQVSQYLEVNVLGSVTAGPVAAPPAAQSSSGSARQSVVSGGSDFALANVGLAYLDRYATKRVGMIPPSESFEPVARSLTQFSRMSLVRGSGFEVFVDYETTTMTEAEFLSLPDVNGVGANPFCDAAWCTPVQVIVGMGSSVSGGSRALASQGLISAGSNMVIHYDGDDRDGMTRVRMELCDRPTSSGQAICEPAVEVILPDGTPSAAVGTVNGLLQFYAPYKYTTTSVRSRNFYTADLWIDPPANR